MLECGNQYGIQIDVSWVEFDADQVGKAYEYEWFYSLWTLLKTGIICLSLLQRGQLIYWHPAGGRLIFQCRHDMIRRNAEILEVP